MQLLKIGALGTIVILSYGHIDVEADNGERSAKIVREFDQICRELHRLDAVNDRRAIQTSRYANRMCTLLDETWPGNPAQHTALVSRVIREWGTGSDCLDLAAVQILRTRAGRTKSELISATVLQRVRDNPKLLPQVFWHSRWNDGASFQSTFYLLNLMNTEEMGHCTMLYWVLLQASALGCDSLEATGIDGLDRCFFRMQWYIEMHRQYLYYDKDKCSYKVDAGAMLSKQPVAPERQRWEPATVPLPSWGEHQ